jgi:hypothetical protein
VRNFSFDSTQIGEMVNLYSTGESLRSIGTKFGTNAQTVRRLVTKAGVIVRGRGRPKLSENVSPLKTLTPVVIMDTTTQEQVEAYIESAPRIVSF